MSAEQILEDIWAQRIGVLKDMPRPRGLRVYLDGESAFVLAAHLPKGGHSSLVHGADRDSIFGMPVYQVSGKDRIIHVVANP